jgi:hypothetical protein
VPSPIFVAAIIGVENLLRIDLDGTQEPVSFVRQVLDRLPEGAPAFGKPIGFVINYCPDKAVSLSVLAAATRSAFDSTDRVGFLALVAGDVTLRRDAVFDWALPLLGAALFVFRDFMERVDIVWAPLVRGAGLDARTTQSPANRKASPLV